MKSIPIRNPFPGAVCHLIEGCGSTQDEARLLARRGCAEGSLVAAESQRAGRGRFAERAWESEAGKNLLFTIVLDPRIAAMPALPLRVGAALCDALALYAAEAAKPLGDRLRLKWPNDILIDDKKTAGILCEAGAEALLVGVGLNCNQKTFGPPLAPRAASLALALGAEIDRWVLLEIFLGMLRTALGASDWKEKVERLLWRRGQRVFFAPGLERETLLEGIMLGIDEAGSLLLRTEGAGPVEAFAAGELRAHPLPPGMAAEAARRQSSRD